MRRGRPASKTYLLARQADLFPDPAYTAYLEKRYPYLRAMRETLIRDSRDGGAAAGLAARVGALPPCTNRGGKVEQAKVKGMTK